MNLQQREEIRKFSLDEKMQQTIHISPSCNLDIFKWIQQTFKRKFHSFVIYLFFTQVLLIIKSYVGDSVGCNAFQSNALL